MQTRDKSKIEISEFSSKLAYTYDWFESNFKKAVEESFSDFWEQDISAKLVSISENTNFLEQSNKVFVTKIRLNKELSTFVRLSSELVKNLLEKFLGPNGKQFNIEKITDLEAKILTGFDNFLYKNFSHLLKQNDELPKNNTNYDECNLTFLLRLGNLLLGKLVIKVPVVAINPIPITLEKESFSISDFLNTEAFVNLHVGHSKIRLNDLKSLEPDDIVLLEQSNSTKMVLRYDDFIKDIKVAPNPAIMIDYDIEEEGINSKGEKHMGNDIYNMWDTIQVEIGAEFEKVKLTLGELKQISEGLVVDIGSIYDNQIDLKVENKIVASGELVIINDRYGVKINQIFTEEKDEASQNYVNSNGEYDDNDDDDFDDEETNFPMADKFEDAPQSNNNEVNEEDFDYSDFDVEDEDI